MCARFACGARDQSTQWVLDIDEAGLRAGQAPPSALDRVRHVARRERNARFTALFHHITIDRLRAAFLLLEKQASPGVDGVTWEQYRAGLVAL
jgi:hypothetical protein